MNNYFSTHFQISLFSYYYILHLQDVMKENQIKITKHEIASYMLEAFFHIKKKKLYSAELGLYANQIDELPKERKKNIRCSYTIETQNKINAIERFFKYKYMLRYSAIFHYLAVHRTNELDNYIIQRCIEFTKKQNINYYKRSIS
jgi:hypothetical protein